MATKAEVLSRLRAATGPDRGLDHDVCCAILGKPKGLLMDHETYVWAVGDDLLTSKELRGTASTDAALALVEHALPGAEYEITTLYGVARVSLPLNASDGGWSCGSSETGSVPLAICIALLEALVAQEAA